jgi:hypothetical protein
MCIRWFLILFVFTACHTLHQDAPLRGTVVDPQGPARR